MQDPNFRVWDYFTVENALDVDIEEACLEAAKNARYLYQEVAINELLRRYKEVKREYDKGN